MGIKYKKNPSDDIEYVWRTIKDKDVPAHNRLLAVSEKTPKGVRAWIVSIEGVKGETADKSRASSWLKNEYRPATKAEVASVKPSSLRWDDDKADYVKNPYLPSMTQADLFCKGDTPYFVDVGDLTIEQLKSLPRSSYTDDEWENLGSEIKTHILIGGDKPDPSLTRVEFDEEDWESLPEDVREYIYEHDPESKARVEALADLIASIVKDNNDENNVLENSEGTIDHYMGDSDWLWERFGEKVKDWADEEMGEGNYDEDALEQAAKDEGLVMNNAEFSVTSYYNGDFPGESSGFYLDQYGLEHTLDSDQIDEMTDDEIARAIEKADDIESNVSHEGLEVDEFRELFDRKKHAEISREPDYESFDINIDWNWDGEGGVFDSIREALDWEPGAPVEQFIEHVPEDRVLASLELSDGVYNIIDLLPSELPKETKKMNHCVGKSQFGYADAIRSGRTRILSVRPESGDNVWKRTITMEVSVNPPDNTSNIQDLVDEGKITHIVQMKGTRNRVPGFERPLPGQRAEIKDFTSPDEFNNMVKVANAVGFNVDDVPDLQPGFHAFKAMKSLPGPKRNPPRKIYIQMPKRTFDMPAS